MLRLSFQIFTWVNGFVSVVWDGLAFLRCSSQLSLLGSRLSDLPLEDRIPDFIRDHPLTTGSYQAYRAISTGQLSALLHLHLRPIDVVVFHGPQGDLVLRGASRLDAFSGYPVRT